MKFEAEKDMKEALDRGCVVSNKLCRRSKCKLFQFNLLNKFNPISKNSL